MTVRADTPRVDEHAGQITDVVEMEMGDEHGFQAPEIEAGVDEGRRRSTSAVHDEDSPVDDQRGRDPGAAGNGHRCGRRSQEQQFCGHRTQPRYARLAAVRVWIPVSRVGCRTGANLELWLVGTSWAIRPAFAARS